MDADLQLFLDDVFLENFDGTINGYFKLTSYFIYLCTDDENVSTREFLKPVVDDQNLRYYFRKLKFFSDDDDYLFD